LGALTSLTRLSLGGMEALRLPASIGHLTGLQTLELDHVLELIEVPASIEKLTGLRILRLTTARTYSSPVWRALARALPSFQRLESLQVRGGYRGPYANDFEIDIECVLAIARSIRAWPLPCVSDFRMLEDQADDTTLRMLKNQAGDTLDSSSEEEEERSWSIDFERDSRRRSACDDAWKKLWQEHNLRFSEVLALNPDDDFKNETHLLQHFQVQLHKMVAFLGGLHSRLGSGSKVSWLHPQMVMLIADEVLPGRSSLRKEWQNEEEEGERKSLGSVLDEGGG